MVLVAIHDGNDLVCGFLQGFGHGTADFQDICFARLVAHDACYSAASRTSFCPWLRKSDIQGPLLPTHIFFCAAKEVGLFALFLEELHDELSPASLLVGAVYGAH